MSTESLSELVETLKTRRGWSQAELARQSGAAETTLIRIGRMEGARSDTLRKLDKVFALPPGTATRVLEDDLAIERALALADDPAARVAADQGDTIAFAAGGTLTHSDETAPKVDLDVLYVIQDLPLRLQEPGDPDESPVDTEVVNADGRVVAVVALRRVGQQQNPRGRWSNLEKDAGWVRLQASRIYGDDVPLLFCLVGDGAEDVVYAAEGRAEALQDYGIHVAAGRHQMQAAFGWVAG